MRQLTGSLASAILLLSAAGCSSLPLDAPSSGATATESVNPHTLRQLQDWKIRAGLYDAHHAPAVLNYVADVNIDDGLYAGECRSTLEELQAHTHGLLKAPTPTLRKDAARVHRANVRYLRSCIRGRVVAWHHAKGAFDSATGQANADYARAVGADPTRYDAPKVFD